MHRLASPTPVPPFRLARFLITNVACCAGMVAGMVVPSEAEAANAWIEENFQDAEIITGSRSGEQRVDTPVWFRDYTGTGGRYPIRLMGADTPEGRRAALTNVTITDASAAQSRHGAAVGVPRYSRTEDMEIYISNVTLEPNWPDWAGYDATNYDGLMNNNSAALYAEDLTIRGWNADSAIDNKADISQFVNLNVSGSGNRSLRFWREGPHYIVNSTITKDGGGPILWGRRCSDTTWYVYNSTFNGSSEVPLDRILCNEEPATAANIVYLDYDPRTTGEMHPMFGAGGGGTGPGGGTPTGPACSLIRAANQPDGWGAAHNVFSEAGELIVKSDCTADGFTPEVGSSLTGAANFAVYTTGYYFDGSDWQEITLGPDDGAEQYGSWILGDAVGDMIEYQSDDTFFAVYSCHWRGDDGWQCGCQDESCGTPAWQLQANRGPTP